MRAGGQVTHTPSSHHLGVSIRLALSIAGSLTMLMLAASGASASAGVADARADAAGADEVSANLTYTVPAGGDRVLAVLVSWDSTNGATLSNVTYGGIALTCHGTASNGTHVATAVCHLVAPSEGAAVLQVDWSAAVPERVIHVITLTGVDQADAVGDAVLADGNGTTATAGLDTVGADSLVIGAVVSNGNATSLSPAAGTTEHNETTAGTGTAGLLYTSPSPRD